ncbi:MAG TPA: F0F1 ATP synthase subunit delta [Acetobacteraceae bacterium]|jgi:F-type H+-transporting ATPase subunit b|nr:F0F1 ATP synthase subunit delta [Acetobacteraceae bacterium]
MRIDLWTLALQTVNVLVLVWLLARFLFRPVASVIAARREAADKLLADAETQRRQAADAAADVAHQRDGLAAEGQRILADARIAAEAERTTLLQRATDAAAQFQAEAQKAMSRDRQTMREALEREATDLALTIAARLLQRVPPRELNRAFVETLAEALATQPARAPLATANLELRSAVPLDGTAQADARTVLARVLGAPPRITFRTDPTLLAGVELTGPSVLIRNSWRADLDRIAHALHETTTNVISQPVA